MKLKKSVPFLASALAMGVAASQIPAASAAETVYDAVVSKLDTGGVLLAYMDIAQDPEKLAESIEEIYVAASAANPNMAPLPFDISDTIGSLGFFGIDGVGASSKADESGYFVNKFYMYTPEGRQGLLALAGGAPRAIDLPQRAPADAALAFDMDFDASVLRDLALQLAAAVMGPAGEDVVNGALAKPVGPLQWTWEDVLKRANTRLTGVVSLDASLPRIEIENGASSIPGFDGLIALDGFGGLVEQLRPMAESGGQAVWEDADAYEILRVTAPMPPEVGYMAPIIARIKANDRLVFATRIEYLDAFLGGGAKLASAPEYKELARGFPAEGNSFTFVSAKMTEVMEDVMRRGVEKDGDPGAQAVFDAIQKSELLASSAMAGVGVNEPQGLYSISRSKSSLKASIFSLPAAIATAGAAQYFSQRAALDEQSDDAEYEGDYEYNEDSYYDESYDESGYEEDAQYEDSYSE